MTWARCVTHETSALDPRIAVQLVSKWCRGSASCRGRGYYHQCRQAVRMICPRFSAILQLDIEHAYHVQKARRRQLQSFHRPPPRSLDRGRVLFEERRLGDAQQFEHTAARRGAFGSKRAKAEPTRTQHGSCLRKELASGFSGWVSLHFEVRSELQRSRRGYDLALVRSYDSNARWPRSEFGSYPSSAQRFRGRRALPLRDRLHAAHASGWRVLQCAARRDPVRTELRAAELGAHSRVRAGRRARCQALPRWPWWKAEVYLDVQNVHRHRSSEPLRRGRVQLQPTRSARVHHRPAHAAGRRCEYEGSNGEFFRSIAGVLLLFAVRLRLYSRVLLIGSSGGGRSARARGPFGSSPSRHRRATRSRHRHAGRRRPRPGRLRCEALQIGLTARSRRRRTS